MNKYNKSCIKKIVFFIHMFKIIQINCYLVMYEVQYFNNRTNNKPSHWTSVYGG